ncbi:hypothetical protein Ocin01_04490 [Orchesella cincta]|uniref:Atos-like conserved domain-containing protein n=1 Tax=Orchesella cincta TaxID=48709 RepID=A0A1D2NAA2_ORCCI|nr:hypothetical protein Ocin01_04490 [Orchesella cincta]
MMQKMVDLERTNFSTSIPSSSTSSSSSSSLFSSSSSNSPLSPPDMMIGIGSQSQLSSIMTVSPDPKTPTQFLMGLGVQILEGRLPDHKQAKGFSEGDHCTSLFKSVSHYCDYETDPLCRQLASLQFLLMSDPSNLTLEVVLTPTSNNSATSTTNSSGNNMIQNEMLIEKWRVTLVPDEETEACVDSTGGNRGGPILMTPRNLHNAVRSFLHFSQLAAWLSKKKNFTSAWKVRIDTTDSGAVLKEGWDRHEFPAVSLESQSVWDTTHHHNRGWNKGRSISKWMVKVTVDSLPRMENFPPLPVPCHISSITKPCLSTNKSQTFYGMLGESEENVSGVRIRFRGGRSRRNASAGSSHRRPKNLRIAIPESTQTSDDETTSGDVQNKEAITGNQNVKIPTLREKLQFETSLNHATSLVFHKSGLPLTSSPAPIRRLGVATAGRFDFDSTLIPKCSRGRAVGCSHFHGQRLSEPSQSLLGSFEESVLNGRIEPVSTVEGFTAEVDVGSSHNFKLPVTVFFYTFCDNDRVSAPYMAHVSLSPTVYPVRRRGTLQVTLYNPMKTVVKMFVINYDLSSMPANSQTFIRQKILFMPLGKSDRDPNARKWLRYLIHLRFGSSATGDKIYLHKDIRMIVLQKSDADTALGLSSFTRGVNCHAKDENDNAEPYELRSFTYSADIPPCK